MNIESVEQLNEAGAGSQVLDRDDDEWTKHDDGGWTKHDDGGWLLGSGPLARSADTLLAGHGPLRFLVRFYTRDEPTLSTRQQAQLRDELNDLRLSVLDASPDDPFVQRVEVLLTTYFPERFPHDAFEIPPGAEGMK